MTDNKKILGKRIKQLRKLAGFTQDDLAERIGIETGSLSGIESGRNFPSMNTVEKISNALKVELRALFDFDRTLSVQEMKRFIIENIDRLDDCQIPYIYKFFDGMK